MAMSVRRKETDASSLSGLKKGMSEYFVNQGNEIIDYQDVSDN